MVRKKILSWRKMDWSFRKSISCQKMEDSCWKKGSLTVETAAVMSVVLFVLIAALYLCFFVHNRAWLTAAAYEAALTGSMEALKDDGKIYEVTK